MAGDSVERLRGWASGRCLSADLPGVYSHQGIKWSETTACENRSIQQLIAPMADVISYQYAKRLNCAYGVQYFIGGFRMSTLLDEAFYQLIHRQWNGFAPRWPVFGCRFLGLVFVRRSRLIKKPKPLMPFGAEGEFLSAGKKLLDTRHPAFKLVTGVKTRAVSYWKGVSLPYPEAGIRLIRQDEIDQFDQKMGGLKAELEEAVWRLDEHFAELKDAARQRLGSLYNSADYPASLQGLFGIEHDFPAIEPPDYLRQLNPELYEQECQRVRIGSMKLSDWPKRRSPANWPSWFRI